jgi:DUF917 family protein
MRTITVDDLPDLALGATLLGTGGGGDPYIATLVTRQAIETHGPVPLVNAGDLDPDALVLTAAMMGAPTVLLEKVPSGPEFAGSVSALASYLGGRPAAILPVEVGGMNTLVPIAVAAELGLPVVDADAMRRAFPQIEMTVFTLAGIGATPMSLADEKGNAVVLKATTNQMAERLARAAVVQLGMTAGVSCYPMMARQVAAHAVLGSLTFCMELGRRLSAVQRGVPGAYEEFLDVAEGRLIFEGKIIDIDRRSTDGFARGTVVLEHLTDLDRTLRVEIQNELLMAFEDGRPVVTTPDLICMLDHEYAVPITTEALAYGQRVDVIGMPCAPKWNQPGFLDIVGPRAFGYDIDYSPLAPVTTTGGAR